MISILDIRGEWLLRWSDGCRGGQLEHAAKPLVDDSRWLPAIVPGDVHLDLERSGLLADPMRGLGVLQARWVEEAWWSYRRTIHVDPAQVAARAWLVFEAIELGATIILNGVEVGRHANAHRPCRIDVTDRLLPGDNVLVVHVESGLFALAERTVPPHTAGGFDVRLHKRHWQRRVQSQSGWDWAPRLLNVGITGDVRLEMTDDPFRIEAFVPLAQVDVDGRMGKVHVRVMMDNLTAEPLAIACAVGIAGSAARTMVAATLAPGANVVTVDLEVASPALWWPRGHGEQHLHAIDLVVSSAAHRQTAQASIGFRHVCFRQEPDALGVSFALHINGRAIFAKGANWVPADAIQARIDDRRYDTLLRLAEQANFNFLRVWGGGLYEDDHFYRRCDELGILVWQDFCFSCAKYPATDEGFHREVVAEAVANIRRLAPHPSLVAWCGNNEIQMGLEGQDWERGVVAPDYALYHFTLPRLLKTEDPTRHYQPSSPWSPDQGPANADSSGDQHPWTVGIRGQDFREYRQMTCRFASEGGYLGPTSLLTMRACLDAGWRTTSSFHWQLHDNAIASWAEPNWPDTAVALHLGKDIRALSIDAYCYWGGLLQGEALREYFENFRRRAPASAGALFWMFNDCWPATRSWTIVDFYGRYTPAFHPVRRALAPIALAIAIDGEEVTVTAMNDGDQVELDLRFGLLGVAGGYPLDRTSRVLLRGNATTRIAAFPRSRWTDDLAMLAFAVLTDGSGQTIARARLLAPLAREVRWAQPDVRVTCAQGIATFEATVFAWGVCLDLEGEMDLADNFFDLYPGQPYTIPWPHGTPPVIVGVGNLVEPMPSAGLPA